MAFLAAVEKNSEFDGYDIRRGLDVLLTCMVDVGGKHKKTVNVTPNNHYHSKRTASAFMRKRASTTVHPVLARLASKKRKKVCGYIFKADEIAYSCRDCQHDSTCVMCQACFADSNHEGHDVSFQRTSAGGCCDCGDAEAWAKSGFCSKHPGRDKIVVPATSSSSSKGFNSLLELPKGMVFIAEPLIHTVVQFIFDTLCTAEDAVEVCNHMRRVYREASTATREAWKKEGEEKHAIERPIAPPGEEAATDAAQYDIRLHSDDIHPFNEVRIVVSIVDDDGANVPSSSPWSLSCFSSYLYIYVCNTTRHSSVIDMVRFLQTICRIASCSSIAKGETGIEPYACASCPSCVCVFCITCFALSSS